MKLWRTKLTEQHLQNKSLLGITINIGGTKNEGYIGTKYWHDPDLVPGPVFRAAALTPCLQETLLGHIQKNGRITESVNSDAPAGEASLSGMVYLADSGLFMIKKTDPPSDGSMDKDSKLVLLGRDGKPLNSPWTTAYGDCDLTQGEPARGEKASSTFQANVGSHGRSPPQAAQREWCHPHRP